MPTLRALSLSVVIERLPEVRDSRRRPRHDLRRDPRPRTGAVGIGDAARQRRARGQQPRPRADAAASRALRHRGGFARVGEAPARRRDRAATRTIVTAGDEGIELPRSRRAPVPTTIRRSHAILGSGNSGHRRVPDGVRVGPGPASRAGLEARQGQRAPLEGEQPVMSRNV